MSNEKTKHKFEPMSLETFGGIMVGGALAATAIVGGKLMQDRHDHGKAGHNTPIERTGGHEGTVTTHDSQVGTGTVKFNGKEFHASQNH